jgi:hypothetical protein
MCIKKGREIMVVQKVGTSVKHDGYSKIVELDPKKPNILKECGNTFYTPYVMSALPGVITSLAKAVQFSSLESLSTNVNVVANAVKLGFLGEGLSILAAPFKVHGLYTAHTKFQKRDKDGNREVTKTDFAHEIAASTGAILSAVNHADKHVSGFTVCENTKPYLSALKQASGVVVGLTTLVSSGPKLWEAYTDGEFNKFTLDLKLLIVKVIAATVSMTAAIAKLAECGGLKSSRTSVVKGLEVIGALASVASIAVRILEGHQKKVHAYKKKGNFVPVTLVADRANNAT